jgi:site-specific recombinase XerD
VIGDGPQASPYAPDTAGLLAAHVVHLERCGSMRTSIDKRLIYLRAFARWLEPASLLDATRQDVETFLDSRRTDYKHPPKGLPITSRTRYHWLSHFGAFYRWAVNDELASKDPTLAIIRPKVRRSIPRPIADDDLARAMAEAPTQMKAMLSLAALMGLRCKEIAGLDREDVAETRDPPVIVVVKGKGGHQRIVPLHPEVLSALRCLPLPRDGAVFVRPNGNRFTPEWMSVVIRAYFADIGIDATAHQLRHWFGTGIYAATHDLRLTQELLGHQSPDTTAIYVAWAAVDAAPAVAALQIGGPAGI